MGTTDPRARIDDGLAASDWNRGRTWDLYVRDAGGDLVPVTTVEQLRAVATELGLTLEEFVDLPSAQAMPAELRRALEDEGVLESG